MLALLPHPQAGKAAVQSLSFECELGASSVLLRYRLHGGLSELALQPAVGQGRQDGLWQHSCFELFVTDGAGYREFNFSPSGAWAVYDFSGYRQALPIPEVVELPLISQRVEADSFELDVALPKGLLPGAGSHWGISAVLETRKGGFSYWALVHPASKPDFHHPDSFIYQP